MAKWMAPAVDRQERLMEWVDRIADEFETAWRSGATPRISDYLGACGGERRAALIRELVLIDFEYRRQSDDDWSFAHYASEFPELSTEFLADSAADPTGSSCDFDADQAAQSRAAAIAACPEYEILESLGCGGMGVVFKARHRLLKRIVAVKMIACDGRTSADAHSRFWTEAEAIARLQHPHIVQIHEIGSHTPFFVLEFVAGGNLRQRLDGQPLPALESAQLVEKLARAIQHAHEQGIVHRDLKPANVLLTSDGEPKITDFGLAKLLDADQEQTRSGAVLGTPSYMAPEQASGLAKEVGPATDVYALGAILYEMLCGRPPFRGLTAIHTLQQVRTDEPVSPRRLQPMVPRDLETICLKALAKAPAARYTSAAALADDLRRFLDGKPILARPAGTINRTVRWCRRSPFQAAAALTAIALTIAMFTFVTLTLHMRAEARQRDVYIQQLAGLVHGNHPIGWSTKAENLARLATHGELMAPRQLAFASLAGLDARMVKKIEGISTASLAFDPRGDRFALSGRNGAGGKAAEAARVWTGLSEDYVASRKGGAGPVAFTRDGAALQLVCANEQGSALILWDIDQQKALCQVELPATDPQRFARIIHNGLGQPLLSLSSQGEFFAAAAKGATNDGGVAVWDRAGNCRLTVPVPAVALALSTAGERIAICDADGHIWIWRVNERRQEAEFRATRATPLSLAFSRDGKRLAIGDSTGTATIWDLATYLPVTYCRGSLGNVNSVAFSPDGTMLATGATDRARVWDAATGQTILEFSHSQSVASLAFSNDGRRLGLVTHPPTHVFIYDLEYGRGVFTLRGLTGQLSALAFSRDGTTVAALNQNWQLAIWNGQNGQRRQIIDVTPSGSAVNAALILSDDGRRLALAANQQARAWDLATGLDTGNWRLPEGQNNCLMFGQENELFLFRVEPGPDDKPTGRIRNLLGANPLVALGEIHDFNLHVFGVRAVPEAMQFIVDGTGNGPGEPRRMVQAIDARQGTAIWVVDSKRSALNGQIAIDAGGQSLALQLGNIRNPASLAQIADGRPIRSLHQVPIAFSQVANYAVSFDAHASRRGLKELQLGRLDRDNPLTTLETEAPQSCTAIFDGDGRHLVWPRQDGLVLLCDLEPARIRLASLGLGW